MVQEKTLPIPAADNPQMIAFSLSSGNGKIIPWLHVDGEWVQQAGVPTSELIAIGVENDLLTLKQHADGVSRN